MLLTTDIDDRDAISCSALRTVATPEAMNIAFSLDDVRTRSIASTAAVTANPNKKDNRGTYQGGTMRFRSTTATSGRPRNRKKGYAGGRIVGEYACDHGD
jgi:hypothetical protein